MAGIVIWCLLSLFMVYAVEGAVNYNLNPDSKPHIIFIVVDDMGNNDIGYNNKDVYTPNIDKLAEEGVILDSNYVYPVCSPSRAAFMTGRYVHKMGLQHDTIANQRPAYIKKQYKTIAEILQSHSYQTHMIGKWHLGFCKKAVTPTKRGFDSFFGFYTGKEDYYTYKTAGKKDFRQNLRQFDPEITNPIDDEVGYATFVFADKVEEKLREHDKTLPLFLYIAFSAPHEPLTAPARHLANYSGEYEYSGGDTDRTAFYAMVTALDEAVGRIREKLEDWGFMENSIIVFTSDNGGLPSAGGFNNPYRGTKGTYYEGGIRVPGFVYSKKYLQVTGYRHKGLFHATDWLPTFLSFAGASSEMDSGGDAYGIDGKDQSGMLRFSNASARDQIIINMNSHTTATTIYGVIKTIGNDVWKYVQGDIGNRDEIYTATLKSKKKRSVRGRLLEMLLKEYENKNLRTSTRALNDKFLFKLSEDSTESTNYFDAQSPLPAQTQLQNIIEAEKNNIEEEFGQQLCPIAKDINDNWWQAGNGNNGWCLDSSCYDV